MEQMKGNIIVHDYGIVDGVQSFRINGLKPDIEDVIHSLILNGVELVDEPIIEPTHPRTFHTTVFKIVLPSEYDD